MHLTLTILGGIAPDHGVSPTARDRRIVVRLLGGGARVSGLEFAYFAGTHRPLRVG